MQGWRGKLGRAAAALRLRVLAFFYARSNPSFFDWPSKDEDDD